jgi:hypothetical protein
VQHTQDFFRRQLANQQAEEQAERGFGYQTSFLNKSYQAKASLSNSMDLCVYVSPPRQLYGNVLFYKSFYYFMSN